MEAVLSVRSVDTHPVREIEFIRVWAWEVPAYEEKGWQIDSAKEGPSTDLFGASHVDVLLVRPVTRIGSPD